MASILSDSRKCELFPSSHDTIAWTSLMVILDKLQIQVVYEVRRMVISSLMHLGKHGNWKHNVFDTVFQYFLHPKLLSALVANINLRWKNQSKKTFYNLILYFHSHLDTQQIRYITIHFLPKFKLIEIWSISENTFVGLLVHGTFIVPAAFTN